MNVKQLSKILNFVKEYDIGITGKFGLLAIGHDKVFYKTEKLELWSHDTKNAIKFIDSLSQECDVVYDISWETSTIHCLHQGFPLKLHFCKNGPIFAQKRYSGVFYMRETPKRNKIEEKEEQYYNDWE